MNDSATLLLGEIKAEFKGWNLTFCDAISDNVQLKKND